MPGLRCIAFFLIAFSTVAFAQDRKESKYFRLGPATDRVASPQAGYALMGGGTDLDEAFSWLCDRAQGGDFLVLRAAGTDAYNPYLQKLCHLNSVATLIIPSREAANDRSVAETIAHAEAIFIAGGDQANYIRFWTGTPVQAAINAAIKRGVPIGGTSAGLAVMGEWAYSAEGDKPDAPNLDSKTALADPTGPRVTLVRGFLKIPALKGIITDSHFVKRDRMGRLLVFLTRIGMSQGTELSPRGLGIDERTAVLLEPDGAASVVGQGNVYFVRPMTATSAIDHAKPTPANYAVKRIESGKTFHLGQRDKLEMHYTLTVEKGKIRSTQSGSAVY